MELKTRRIRITFAVSSETSKEDLMNLCKDYKTDKYDISDEGDFEISFSLNTILEYNEVLHFMELIHMELDRSMKMDGIKYKGMRWTPNETYDIGGTV
ncbi:hypothetical protein [Romboutsia ilealis]|uniref:hypothetical protein n=1 Tax=Romboutsia ilealis TaxID=1115758 RepID=UPI002897B890|nr:hypothetical protein [Romboutsia ilealis]